MRARKTVEVEYVKNLANRQLARTDLTTEARKAIANMLECVLFEANVYRGFNDVYWSKEGGYNAWVADGRPNFPEKSKYIHGGDGTDTCRRFYY